MTPKVPREALFSAEMHEAYGDEWESLPPDWRDEIIADLKYMWVQEGGYRGWGTVNALVIAYKALRERKGSDLVPVGR